MRNYYHSFFTCPQCHVPYEGSLNTGSHLFFTETGNLICSECGTEFHPYVNFSDNFWYLKEHLRWIGIPPDSPNLKKFPLFWNVVLNEIENRYVEWVIQKPKGSFLITWPWSEVRFLPILLTEYSLSHRTEKIVVIGEYEESLPNTKFIGKIPLNKILNKLIYITDPLPVSDPLKKEMIQLKTNRSILFEQKNVVSVKYRKYGSGRIETYICPHSLKKCINNVKKDASDNNFGRSYLRTITQKKKNGQELDGYSLNEVKEKIVDPKCGLWDVTLTEQRQWSGKLNYNILWLADVLQNLDKVTRCQDLLTPVCYYNENQTADAAAKVHFISSKIDPKQIFSLVQNISPDLLIIENTDDMISDIRYIGPVSKALMGYLKNPAGTVLLFSTNPEKRQFYNLESEKNVFSSIHITIQTLDSYPVLTQLSQESRQSKYPNPVSSMLSDIFNENRNKKILCQYIKLDELTAVSQKILSIITSLEKEFARDVRFYLRRVLSSPLHIIGDYSDSRFLSAKKRFSGLSITYSSLYHDLVEHADVGQISQEIPELFRNTFYSQYHLDTNQNKNPLKDEFFRKANELFNQNPHIIIIFVVNFQDVSGLEKIIEEDTDLSNELKAIILVSSWSDLHEKETTLDKMIPRYVISSQYPSLKYNLRNSQIKEFIFISDNEGIEGIKEIIDYRLLERFTFPVVIPSEEWKGPHFLRESLKKIELPAPARINELYKNEDEECFQFSDWKHVDTEFHEPLQSQHLLNINIGDEVILCIDRSDKAIFIPFGKSVMIYKDELPEDILVDPKSSEVEIEKKIYMKEIILGRPGLFLSFRGIFFKFMMEYGRRMTFQKRPYTWEGYENLFNDSVFWIRLIEKAIQEYTKQDPTKHQNADIIISKKLIESGITAKELGTVTGWITNYDEISLNSGQYRLYRTEHPFRLEDLRIIFAVLHEFVPKSDFTIIEPERVYAASLCLQDFRRKVFQSSPEDNLSFYSIRAGLKKEINNILIGTERFTPLIIKRVNITKLVQPMEILKDYKNYI